MRRTVAATFSFAIRGDKNRLEACVAAKTISIKDE